MGDKMNTAQKLREEFKKSTMSGREMGKTYWSSKLNGYLKALDDVDRLLKLAESEYVNREMAVYNKLRKKIRELRG